MKRTPARKLIGLAVVLALGVAAVSASDSAPSAALQQRIDALLKRRFKPEPLPLNPPNPFQPVPDARREPAWDDVASKPAVADQAANSAANGHLAAQVPAGPTASEILLTCATRLKVGGVVVVKDQIQVVVNGITRKEGDNVAVDFNNTIVQLKIARILPGQMVVRYGEAEATVKF